MFKFKADIIKRRKFSKSYFLLGLIAIGLLAYTAITFFEKGFVPFVEMIIDQIGVQAYTSWIYLGVFAVLAFFIIPAIRTFYKKKTIIGGMVSFDEDKLEIKKGKEHLIIPEKDLSQLNFELKQLPAEGEESKG